MRQASAFGLVHDRWKPEGLRCRHCNARLYDCSGDDEPTGNGENIPDQLEFSMGGIPVYRPHSWLGAIGATLQYLKHPKELMQDVYEQCGPVARMNLFGMSAIVLLGPDCNARLLLNSEGEFSSEHGWRPLIGATFPNGLISMDGEKHRADRRTIGAAFKPGPLQAYISAMEKPIVAAIDSWPDRMSFYPLIKRLTLRLASTVLLGLPLGATAEMVSGCLNDMLAASAALVRRPFPGNGLWRGNLARRRLVSLLNTEVRNRRGRIAPDLFSVICNAEEGRELDDAAVTDHILLLMMAAHDTTTSALTSSLMMLGMYPDWQEKLRMEVTSLVANTGETLSLESLEHLELTELFLCEVLRTYPPVVSLPRYTTRDIEILGHSIPKGTAVGINILHSHYMPSIWADPNEFMPERFAPEAVRKPHRHAWVPFGGGMHKCIGLHFAMLKTKLFLGHLLLRRQVILSLNYQPRMQWLPVLRPVDGLPVLLQPLR